MLILNKKIDKIIYMEITCVKVNNFRNYANQIAYFSPKTNLLVGNNAQGKTNLIEAIYFCSIGKSPRVSNEKDLINYSSQKAKIECELNSNGGGKKIEIILNKNSKKIVKINQINILKISSLLGTLKCVFFSPDELKLIKETPEDRRKFLNTDISQLSKRYFNSLIKYNKILQERNNLLKNSKDQNVVKQTIDIWNEQLSLEGAFIIKERLKYVERIKKHINNIHSYLTNNAENLEILYQNYKIEDINDIQSQLKFQLENSFERDFRFGYTTVGPHRDDLKFFINGQEVKNFASQGQQRTVALSIKLSEVEIFKEVMNEYPVLLLDDVLSELDESRKKRLFDLIKNYQTIITTTNFEGLEKIEAHKIWIENAIIKVKN